MTNDKPANIEELAAEIQEVLDGSAESYDASADSLWRVAALAFDFAARKQGATGFQASWAAMKFYAEVMHVEGPFMVVRMADALYPQYDLPARVQEAIEDQAPWLREQAIKKIAEVEAGKSSPVDTVRAHWEKLAAWRQS